MSLCPAISGWALAHWLHQYHAWGSRTPVTHFLRCAWITYSIAHF